MSTRSVNFLLSGDAHAPYLIVALNSLRRNYDGTIHVWAYPESIDCVQLIARDPRLRIQAKLWEPEYHNKNSQFLNKIYMMQQTGTEYSLYLDADLVISGEIDTLFANAKIVGFTATQFCNWTTQFKVIQNRLKRLLGRDGVNQDNVQRVLRDPHPSVNGGVFCCHQDSKVLKEWAIATKKVIDLFIADECVLHTFVGTDYAHVTKGGFWNCSPKYRPDSVQPDKIRIWHGHGDSFVRPSKCQAGVDLWLPEYRECLVKNLGNVKEWKDTATTQNRFLTDLAKEVGGL